MSAATGPFDQAEIAKAEVGTGEGLSHVKNELIVDQQALSEYTDDDSSDFPTQEELDTLRRVSGPIKWQAFTVAFVELCERFSWYGSTVVYTNFIQRPLPPGSTTGAGFAKQSGALGLGQRASTGLGTFNNFWAYITPLFGAYLADAKWGRYKTIQYAIVAALLGHIILTVSAAPAVIQQPGAVGAFVVGLLVLGTGTGGFKSNISPLLAEQQTVLKMKVETRAEGERVIVDPSITSSRMFLWFYVCINIGSVVGQVAMVYAEKYVGFWLSFALPTVMFIFCPIVLLLCKKYYKLTPPAGSVLGNFFKLVGFSMKGRWSANPIRTFKNMRGDAFWERAKPSNVVQRPAWMIYDDAWVDQVRRGCHACAVFLWMPLYWLAYNQMTNNLTSQAATMQLNGVPNDLINNLNPISILIFIPFLDFFLYPTLRKMRINFSPLKRMATGYFLASAAMISATVIQYYIYKTGPCGSYMNTCEDADGNVLFAPINVWIQCVPYALIGFSEIFTNVTSLEYAFTKAPKNMRSLVMAINLFMNAIASAIAQGLVSLSEDPLLVWNYGVVAVLAFIGGVAFWLTHRHQDHLEDEMNLLAETQYLGRKGSVVADPEKTS